MARLAGFWKKVTEGWTVQRIAAVLAVVGGVVFVAGVVNKHCACAGLPNLGETLNDIVSDFYANVSVDCLSIAFAILVIDRLNERRAEEQEKAKEQQVKADAEAQLKAQLIREMGSSDNGIALRAVQEAWANGCILDGSLREVNFSGADLQKANLKGANLQGARLAEANLQGANLDSADLQQTMMYKVNLQQANLSGANLQFAFLLGVNLCRAMMIKAQLQGANLQWANLEQAILWHANLQETHLDEANVRNAYLREVDLRDAHSLTDQKLVIVGNLQGTILPDGQRYNGRFNLRGDYFAGVQEKIDFDSPEAMAEWYGVSLDNYLAGQEWARENLPRLRREAGLDPDTGLPVEPTNGVEPQPADAPAQPSSRRNGHKASMVAHRIQR